MKKILVLMMSAIFVLSACGEKKEASENADEKPVVKIGAILPLSGSNSLMGESYRNLLQMRMDEISKNSKFDYKIIFEDDQFDLKKEILAAQKLINVDNVDVIFTSSAGGEAAIADLARGKNKIIFSNLWDKDLPKNNDFFFNYVPTPEQHAEVLAKELAKRNIKTVSTVINNHRGSFLSINEFKQIAQKHGINIIDEQTINMDTTDFALMVAKMNEKNPEIYVCNLFPPSSDRWKQELIRQRITTPTTGMNVQDYSNHKELWEGSWYVSDSLINEELSAKYESNYGKELAITQAFVAYATLDALISTYEKYDDKPSVKQIAKDLLAYKNSNSAVGEMSWSAERLFEVKPIVKIIQNGKAVALKN